MRGGSHRITPVSEAVHIVPGIASDHGNKGVQEKSDYEEYLEK